MNKKEIEVSKLILVEKMSALIKREDGLSNQIDTLTKMEVPEFEEQVV